MTDIPPRDPGPPDDADDLVDEQGEESFPASDPPETGGPSV